MSGVEKRMRGRPRGTNTVKVCVRLNPDIVRLVREAAKTQRRTFTAQLQIYIEAGLAEKV
jgi:hypothetical protein